MTTIGSSEARANLPQLLDEVAKGKKITITRHGKPVAMLVPPHKEVRKVIEDFRAFSRQRGRTLGKMSIREMIDEGRRY